MTYLFYFFFNDTATTEIYTLSLHDALPIFTAGDEDHLTWVAIGHESAPLSDLADALNVLLYNRTDGHRDRKSTRLNSSHANISYAVFCLKKNNNNKSIANV